MINQYITVHIYALLSALISFSFSLVFVLTMLALGIIGVTEIAEADRQVEYFTISSHVCACGYS